MRFVSILGDSVSTFEGCNPEGYAVFYDRQTQERNQLTAVRDTWWARVCQALRACLCVNNSYSGSTVSGRIFPAGECEARLRCLRTADNTPDLILIYLGFNDFGRGIRVRPAKRFFHTDRRTPCFENSYDAMLRTMQSYYPGVEIVCGTLMRTGVRDKRDWAFPETFAGTALEEYNDAIRRTARRRHCLLADLAASGERYETLDGSHPTARGHLTMARAWIRCLDALGLLEPSGEGRE